MIFEAVPRFPFAPLAAAIGEVYWSRREFRVEFSADRRRGVSSSDRFWQRNQGNPVSLIAEVVGRDRRSIQRWVTKGVPEEHADKIACAFGMHPSEIWPEWFEGAVA